jgi:hypothetical protein
MSSPWRPVLVTAAAYAAFTLLGLALHGWTPLWFVWIGERWSDGVAGGRTGYDGQFVYYLARDGWAALPHLDAPGYRMSRVLYPLLAAALSGGRTALVPWAMVAINYVAVVAATAMLARWLVARATSPWWALAYPGSAGMLFAYSRDCTEPLAYALAAGGAVAWLDGRRGRAWAPLALAPLAREATTLVTAGLMAAALAARRGRDALGLAATLLPMLAWQLYLIANVPVSTLGLAHVLQLVPLAAVLAADLTRNRLASLLFLGLPALALLPGAFAWLARTPAAPLPWLIALHALLVLIAPAESYVDPLGLARVAVGLVLALVLAFPVLSPSLRAVTTAIAVLPSLVWLAPMLWWAPWTAVR